MKKTVNRKKISMALPRVKKFQNKTRRADIKKKRDETETAKVYEEFVASFAVKETPLSSNQFNNLNSLSSPALKTIRVTSSSPFNLFSIFSLMIMFHTSRNFTVMKPRIKPTKPFNQTNKAPKQVGKSGKTVKNIDLFVQEMKLNEIVRQKEKQNLIKTRYSEKIDDDPLSSNVIIYNVPKKVSENNIFSALKKHGEISTVRITDPTKAEQRSNVPRTADVNFMLRNDALKCVSYLSKNPLFENENAVSASLGKRLPKTSFPLKENEKSDEGKFEEGSEKDTVIVKEPSSQKQKQLIDLVSKFVSQNGSHFENHLIKLHRGDDAFSFLNNGCENNTYYRWRVYSYSQENRTDNWRKERFKYVKGGNFWIPPKTSSIKIPTEKPLLSMNPKKSEELNALISKVSKNRKSVRDAMGFCIDNSEHAPQVVQTISRLLRETIKDDKSVPKSIAILFLVSDVLYNSDSRVQNSSAYRSEFQQKLGEMFCSLRKIYGSINGRITAEKMKEEVCTVLHVWQAWSIFPLNFLEGLKKEFLGEENNEVLEINEEVEDVDGIPLDDEDVDGFEIDF